MIDLTPRQQQLTVQVLQTFLQPDEKVWVFGSRIRGTARKWSDLDLMIHGPEKLPVTRFYQLMDAFEESELDIRVDVLDWHRTSREFRQRLTQDGMEPFPVNG
ncbi:MAG: nucleotidyltransferase domain-containing protein [Marinobacterium sp.]|nr:nucleotidyltransferase domain-containing protein [Marinobacterium sp.]